MASHGATRPAAAEGPANSSVPKQQRVGARRTIVLMGDANVDIHSRPGTDTDSYRTMMTKLGLMSCGEARWPGLHKSFKTRQGGVGQSPSHIDYILVSESSASAVRSFGIDANKTLIWQHGEAFYRGS